MTIPLENIWHQIESLPWPLITAFIAAAIAFWQAKMANNQLAQNRLHNKLSVKPLLNFSMETTSGATSSTSLFLANEGVGPAIIKSIEFKLDSKDIEKPKDRFELESLVRRTGISTVACEYTYMHSNSTIAANDKRTLMRVIYDIDGSEDLKEKLLDFTMRLRRVAIIVTYSSIYDEDDFSADLHVIPYTPTEEELKQTWGENK